MRRLTVLLLMLFALLWQSLAMARIGSTVNFLADLEHAALHWHGAGHVHHDDGSYHPDDSTESVQHVQGDQVSSPTALLLCATDVISPTGSAARSGHFETSRPSPALEGLLRPPRPHS